MKPTFYVRQGHGCYNIGHETGDLFVFFTLSELLEFIHENLEDAIIHWNLQPKSGLTDNPNQ